MELQTEWSLKRPKRNAKKMRQPSQSSRLKGDVASDDPGERQSLDPILCLGLARASVEET